MLACAERERDALTFEHAKILADTLQAEELLKLDATELLHRLYHEDDLRLFDAHPVRFQCRCSRERVAGTTPSWTNHGAAATNAAVATADN